MCTLSIRLTPGEDYPIIVIANRDELYNRPSSIPFVIRKNPDIFAPTDLEAGGTWFGVNQYGLVAAITNVWIDGKPGKFHEDSSPKSRGLLTLDVLRCKNTEEARNVIGHNIIKDRYNYFNLLVASTIEAFVCTNANEFSEYPLSDNGTTILNHPYHPQKATFVDIPPFPVAEESVKTETTNWLNTVRQILSRHPDVCKHNDFYGTRSSQVVALSKRDINSGAPLSPDYFWFADGPPCNNDFLDLSPQLQSITQKPKIKEEEI